MKRTLALSHSRTLALSHSRTPISYVHPRLKFLNRPLKIFSFFIAKRVLLIIRKALPTANGVPFVIQQSTDASTWTHGGTSTKSKFTVSGLTSGTKYWFRVSAIGAGGYGVDTNMILN